MYKDTVTVFNRFKDVSGDLFWRATVLTGVDLNVDSAAILATYGASSQDKARLHIKCVNGHIGAISLVKDYQGAPGTITFRSGVDFDFFIPGEWDGLEVLDDEDYTDGFYNFMNRSYGAFAISSAALYSVIPHLEIFGR